MFLFNTKEIELFFYSSKKRKNFQGKIILTTLSVEKHVEPFRFQTKECIKYLHQIIIIS